MEQNTQKGYLAWNRGKIIAKYRREWHGSHSWHKEMIIAQFKLRKLSWKEEMNTRNAIQFGKLVMQFWNDNSKIKMATWYTDRNPIVMQLQTIFNFKVFSWQWEKLKQQYKTHVHERQWSGTDRQKKRKFFDDLDEIWGHRDIISPSSLFDSSTMDGVDSESVGTDDLGK